MRDQYAGDVSDVLKFAFLRSLGIMRQVLTADRMGGIWSGATNPLASPRCPVVCGFVVVACPNHCGP